MASDDEMRDCDSMEGGSSPHMLGNNPHALTNGTGGMTAFNMNLDNTEPSTSRASTQDKNLSLRFVWHNTSSLWAQGRVSFFPFPFPFPQTVNTIISKTIINCSSSSSSIIITWSILTPPWPVSFPARFLHWMRWVTLLEWADYMRFLICPTTMSSRNWNYKLLMER